MKTKTVLTVLVTLLATSLLNLGSAEAGMIKVINNSNFVLGVGVTYTDGSKSGPDIVNPNSSKPGLGSPHKAVARIRIVNTTAGTDPNKAELKDHFTRVHYTWAQYFVTVDSHGNVTVEGSAPVNIL